MPDLSANATRIDSDSALPIPSVSGYAILETLGRGGMGIVYKARNIATDRVVAIKLIRDQAFASPQDLARFQIEANAASRLNHPNIIAVHHVGAVNGLPFYAMDYVEDGGLDRLLASR